MTTTTTIIIITAMCVTDNGGFHDRSRGWRVSATSTTSC